MIDSLKPCTNQLMTFKSSGHFPPLQDLKTRLVEEISRLRSTNQDSEHNKDRATCELEVTALRAPS